MQEVGLGLIGLGAWVMSAVWYDPAEGVFLRLIFGLMILAGIAFFAEGIKRDIIEAVREAAANKQSTGASPQSPPDKRA